MADRKRHIERSEHFVHVSSGVEIHVIEKRLSRSHPSSAVLLIHGVGVGSACWDLCIKDYSSMEFLACGGLDVFAVDQRGYGKSTKPSGLTVTSEQSAEDLISVISFVQRFRHIEKIDVVGHSFGGMVAFCLAGKYPESVKRVVAIGSPYKQVHHDFQEQLGVMAEMAQRGIPYAPNEHHLTVEQKLYSFDPEIIDAYKRLIGSSYPEWPTGVFLDLKSFHHSKYIPKIVAPTLLINGALEYVVDPSDAVRCLHDLGAKQKALMVVGNAFHLVFLEETAHRIFSHAILGWLCS